MYAFSHAVDDDSHSGKRSKLKYRVIVVCILVFGTAGAVAQKCPTGQPKEEIALLETERTWAKALEGRDVFAVGCILADDFEDADVDGQVHNRTDALDRVAHRRPGHNELEGMRAHVYEDVAFVRGVNKVIGADGKRIAQVRFTDIFVYRDGRWQAVAGHETLVTSQSK
jgi:ketosteroid isomerase-like protein